MANAFVEVADGIRFGWRIPWSPVPTGTSRSALQPRCVNLSEAVSRLPLTCALQQTRSHAGDPMTKRLGYSCAAPSTAHSCPSQRLCRGLCKTTHELLKARVTISSQSSSMLMLHSSRSGVQQIRSLRASFILTHNFVLGSISRPLSNEELSVDCQNPAVSRPRSPGTCGSSCTCQLVTPPKILL